MHPEYLMLSNSERNGVGVTGGAIWYNLPTITNSTRPCYFTVINAKLIFNTAKSHDGVNVHARLPVMNYYSSSNDEPLAVMMNTVDSKIYELLTTNEIHLLTNDNLKNVEFILHDNTGDLISIDANDSLEVCIKLEYFNQDEMANTLVSERIKRL